ncbi:MAG: hypothetical protein HQK55_09205 [Deltaproteobacteria bacterium]|nr:hypothetical protein [Deltaproteobacteria bacterium]
MTVSSSNRTASYYNSQMLQSLLGKTTTSGNQSKSSLLSTLKSSINSQLSPYWSSQTNQSSWWQSSTASGTQDNNSLSNLLTQQQSYKVTMNLQKVGKKVLKDMAGETAKYLATKPDLAKDYVLIIVDDPSKGRTVKAYRPEDLVTNLKSPEKEKELAALKQNPLLHCTSDINLPAMSKNDPDITGLANKVQSFLDRNKKVIDLLEKQGMIDWA